MVQARLEALRIEHEVALTRLQNLELHRPPHLMGESGMNLLGKFSPELSGLGPTVSKGEKEGQG